MTKQEYIQGLQGQEIISIFYEGCVSVHGDKVVSKGKIIDTLTKKKKAKCSANNKTSSIDFCTLYGVTNHLYDFNCHCE